MGKRTILLVACAVAVVTGVSLLMQRLPSEPSIPSQPPKANPPNWPVAKPIDVSQGGSTHAVPPVVEPVRPDDVRTQLVGLAISPVVKTIIGFDQDHRSKKDRRAALMKLNRKIPATDVKALRVFLSMRPRDQIGIDQNAFDNIRNEVLDVLFRQNHIPEAMGSQLVRMYRDGQQDDMWRAYCLQYLAQYYELRWPPGSKEVDDPERRDIEAAYSEAMVETGKAFAGTALLGIERLSRTRPELDRTNLANTAVSLAVDETATEGNRITGFRLAAGMGMTNVLPWARITAQTGSTGPLRMAAVATIGDLGDTSDRELLKSLASTTETRIKTTAESALARIEARQALATGKQ